METCRKALIVRKSYLELGRACRAIVELGDAKVWGHQVELG